MPIPVFDLPAELLDISDVMAWSILSSKGLVSPKKALREARNSLALSLVQPDERREEFRLFNPSLGTGVSTHGEVLLNVSRSGIAVGVSRKCTFARGEHYKVTLDDGTTQADLEGRVCWTRSTWPRGAFEGNGGDYFQAAGMAISERLSVEQEERWRALRTLVQEGSAALDLKIWPAR